MRGGIILAFAVLTPHLWARTTNCKFKVSALRPERKAWRRVTANRLGKEEISFSGLGQRGK
jgi:hypothetical protein